MIAKEAERYAEVDALRGIAAVMVALYHFTLDTPAKHVLSVGNTGVELFFIISGFVISLTINRVSKGSYFVINRISRLYPAYWSAVTFTFCIILVYGIYKHQVLPWGSYLLNLTMFQHYFGVPDLDNSYWTLFVEMQFYALILLLFITRAIKRSEIIGVIVCLVLIAISFLPGSDGIFAAIRLLAFFPLFLAGMVFYRMVTNSQNLAGYAIIVLCLVTQLVIADHGARQSEHISALEYDVMIAIYFIVFTAFINGKLVFLKAAPLLFLGKISYSLYLTHQYIGRHHIMPFVTNRLHLNVWISAIFIALPICIGIACVITYLVEERYNKKFRTLLYRVVESR